MSFQLGLCEAQGARRVFASLATIAAAIILSGCQTMPLSAQDKEKDDEAEVEKKAADPDSAVGKFQAAIAEVDEKQKSLQAMQKEYPKAAKKRQDELEKKFEETRKSVMELFPSVRKLAVAAYLDDPEGDPRAIDFLRTMLAIEFRNDQYEAVLKNATTLIDKGCKDTGVLSLAGSAAYCLDQFDAAGKYFATAEKEGELDASAQRYAEELADTKKAWAKEEKVRKAEAAKDDNPRVKLETSKGDMIVELYEDQAPGAVGNFISLVKKGFYDGLTFHRVLPNFMAQGGDPNGTGSGGPGYKIFCECEKPDHRNHFRGTLSMAHAGKDTGGSQFFLTFQRTSFLDGKHTVFGRVVEGLDVLEKIQRIDPDRPSGAEPDSITKATVIRDRGHEYKPKIASKGD